MHGVIAAGATSNAWSFGSSILAFAFPMILLVAATQLPSAKAETEEGA